MTPGSHPRRVSKRLIRNSLEAIPKRSATARGGSNRVSMIINIDITLLFLDISENTLPKAPVHRRHI
ncbi:hypothetical protein C900_05947 [Fulvivirga imtechensis AK7]|uniref:Uncharacterized protein n=1 Tax=Fulvivirga imtechensis AK7 TaxID=1237149 RepID=L8JMD3_9BACT|nr:hypothetical protein C900_05947 [Fulvivirga imtechensis AK7]